MALITKSSSALSTNGKVLSLSDTTGNYNVTTNPGGYGASQTPAGLREVSDIDDLCQVSQGSNSVTLYSLNDAAGAKYFVIIDGVDEYTYEIISEGSSFVTLDSEVTLTSGDYNYKVIYESTNYLALTHNILKCIHTNIANVACSTCSCKEKAVEKTTEALMQYFGIETNMDKGNYNCAQEIIESLTIYCGKDGCNC